MARTKGSKNKSTLLKEKLIQISQPTIFNSTKETLKVNKLEELSNKVTEKIKTKIVEESSTKPSKNGITCIFCNKSLNANYKLIAIDITNYPTNCPKSLYTAKSCVHRFDGTKETITTPLGECKLIDF